MSPSPVFLLLFFIPGMILMLYFFSKRGWADLAAQYRYTAHFTGNRIGVVSAGINGVSYNGCLLMKTSEEGIWIRPILFFRLFHPPILIPWSELKEVREKKLIFRYREMVIGASAVAFLQVSEKLYEKLDAARPSYSKTENS